ncbi:unnamed protein product [Caenorhabditis sp. 36 PRJEB53466]|nr:unnamed protein product [Caenorhabditis sp. 36 PRJEB53466]
MGNQWTVRPNHSHSAHPAHPIPILCSNGTAAITMNTDEDSRDSGICDMEEGAPTSFGSFQSASHQSEAMEVDEIENTEPDDGSLIQSNRTTISRRKSQVRLFNGVEESPKSALLLFRRPTLTIRSKNGSRKRFGDGDEWVPFKMGKTQETPRASDHYHLESMKVDEEEEQMMDDIMLAHQHHQFHQSTSQQSLRTSSGSLQRHHTVASMMGHLDEEEMEEEEQDESHLVVRYQLKTLRTWCSTLYRRIDANTLIYILSTLTSVEFQAKFILVDCRYPFEFDGGHIKHAVNFYDRDNVATFFFDETGKPRSNRVPIFYCEFSQKRGPSMAYALRKDDRQRNVCNYPNCSYEEMYVLDKGFRNFYHIVQAEPEQKEELCQPNSYVEMNDVRFSGELKKWNFHVEHRRSGQTVQRAEHFATTLCRSATADPALITRNLRSTSFLSTSTFSSCSASSVFSSSASTSSTSSSVVVSTSTNERSTPALHRTASSRRNLFDVNNSPTNFDRPAQLQSSPSPPREDLVLRPPQFT